jgi:hypothetical protein
MNTRQNYTPKTDEAPVVDLNLGFIVTDQPADVLPWTHLDKGMGDIHDGTVTSDGDIVPDADTPLGNDLNVLLDETVVANRQAARRVASAVDCLEASAASYMGTTAH